VKIRTVLIICASGFWRDFVRALFLDLRISFDILYARRTLEGTAFFCLFCFIGFRGSVSGAESLKL